MACFFHRMRRDERGQAIIIAAVGLLIMAVGVLATAQMGFAIYEKQKLQTTADATAYSLATLHARAFNFFAFTNRAMVVHYVAMMHMQAIISALTLMEAMLGTGADIFYDVYGIGCCPPYDDFGCWAMGPFQIMERMRGAITPVLDALDKLAGMKKTGAIALLYELNATKIYRVSQKVFKYTMYLINATGFLQVSQQTDPDIEIGVSRLVSGIANTAVWATLFDDASEGLPRPTGADEKAKKAQRIATEIANASRDPTFLTSRDVMGMGGLNGASASLSPTHGQTKFITAQDKDNIYKKGYYDSELAEGIAMSSKDTAGIGLGGGGMGGIGGSFSITVGVEHAPNQDGKHFRYKKSIPQSYPTPMCGSVRQPFPTDNIEADTSDQNHNDWQGPAPFISLNPDHVRDWKKDFGQHGVLIWLNKQTDKLTRKGLTQKFTMHAPTFQTGIDSRIGQKGFLTTGAFTGINATAAAQVYYHRPGNWREMPNLFNPFWKARLYPVADFLRWAGLNGLPPEIMSLFQNTLLIH